MMNKKSHRIIRSFVRREGRMTQAQRRALAELWDLYGLVPGAEFFNLPEGEIILEIGFGMGDSLVKMAEENPKKFFLGIEVHRPGIGSVLNVIHQKQLQNIKIIEGDAVEILNQNIPNNSIEVIQIFFPDPWPKKRHHKRRLIQPNFVKLLHQKLKKNGLLHVVTDWGNYAEQIDAVFQQSKNFCKIENSRDRSRPVPTMILNRPTTKFEKKGQKLGHKILELIYIKC